ncbi:MAG: hypothetical protein IPM79_16760 [Polyangiaceae bacterium]|nr:hypothetical protein [Polyangiaceae bacterium]MBK8939223.1 hypothetical protein [Polyangiaceae bacterium]
MARKPKLKGAAVPATAAEPHPHYSDAAAAIFRAALAALANKLPDRHGELAALFDAGKLHDFETVEAVLKGGAQ